MYFPNARILVFSKAPTPGQCKTRLIPSIGPEGAAQLQRHLVEIALATAVNSRLAPVELWCAPDTQHAFFRTCRRRHGVRLRAQPNGDLGRRMHQALRHSLRHAEYAVIIGTDCPALAEGHLDEALGALETGDSVVITPSEDGGYVLIGARVNEPRIFRNIDWGTRRVMQQTERNLKHIGLRYTRLEPLWDVDEPEDLHRAQREDLL